MAERVLFKAYSVLSCLLLAAILAAATPEEICEKVVFQRHAYVRFDFCVRILKTDPASATADERGTAVIADHLGYKQAQINLSKINALLQSGTSPAMSVPLKDCQELYGEAAAKLQDAADDSKVGRYSDASILFSSGIDAADTCRSKFAQMKLRSPLEEEYSDLRQICAIGTALTSTASI